MKARIARSRFREIAQRYYNHRAFVSALGSDHAPILYVRFGLEHSDIIATRDRLFELISGAKSLWDLDDSTHYFDAFGKGGIVVGNVSVTRRVAERMTGFAAEVVARREE